MMCHFWILLEQEVSCHSETEAPLRSFLIHVRRNLKGSQWRETKLFLLTKRSSFDSILKRSPKCYQGPNEDNAGLTTYTGYSFNVQPNHYSAILWSNCWHPERWFQTRRILKTSNEAHHYGPLVILLWAKDTSMAKLKIHANIWCPVIPTALKVKATKKPQNKTTNFVDHFY